MDKTSILVLGAGRIGRTIAAFLADAREYSVSVADRNDSALENLTSHHLKTLPIDITNSDLAVGVLAPFDMVISALPYQLNGYAARAAKEAETHYFDLTEDVGSTRDVLSLATGAKTAFMPQCGLAPGFVGIVANGMAAEFDELHDVHLRVGALPRTPTNALQYSMTWSIEGVVNEYCNPCQAIRDGNPAQIDPLAELENFELGAEQYEAFNTSGGLGTLCDTLAGRVRNLDYKSIRYPGHRDIVRHLIQALRPGAGREVIMDFLRAALPKTSDDLVVVYVTVSGILDGQLTVHQFSRKIYSQILLERHMSAIQITTAASACAVIDLFREGKLPTRGFVRQEDVKLGDFLKNRFGRHFESGGSNSDLSRGNDAKPLEGAIP